MNLYTALNNIKIVDKNAKIQTQKRLDSIVKPLGSLGLLEKHLVKIAGCTGSYKFDFSKKAVVVFCADNGVVAQNITQSKQDVTAIVSENLCTGDTCLCAMARVAGADVIPVDIGVASDITHKNLINRKIAYGTKDFSKMPAMTKEKCIKALEIGIDMAIDLKNKGYNILATGEMGIGNTATASAICSVLLGLPPKFTTGKGSGLSNTALQRKIDTIEHAINLHKPNKDDVVDTLSKVGGFDILGMAGLCIGGAVAGIPIVLDGAISASAALVAYKLSNKIIDFILPSHMSTEPVCQKVYEFLQLKPLLDAHMRLGEGTGAVATFPLYDMILACYNDMVTFSDENMEDYIPL